MVHVVSRHPDQAGEPAWCPMCSEESQRMFFPPRLMARSKPGSFKFDGAKMNPWDDRIAHLKNVEDTQGSAGLRKVAGEVGTNLFNATLNYKKKNYAS